MTAALNDYIGAMVQVACALLITGSVAFLVGCAVVAVWKAR